jgi:ATP-binding cassette, subfamily C (CFTR/MRP), member 1
MDEYGSLEKEEKIEEKEKKDEEKSTDASKETGGKKARLMQEEERITGSVAGVVYAKYFRFAGGLVRLPIILVLLAGFQGANGTY